MIIISNLGPLTVTMVRRLSSAVLTWLMLLWHPLPSQSSLIHPNKVLGNKKDLGMRNMAFAPTADKSAGSPNEQVDFKKSNFWYSETRGTVDTERARNYPMLPFDPYLDRDGPLPEGAYLLVGNPHFDPKKLCRLSVAMDLEQSWNSQPGNDELKPMEIVRNIQSLIDGGINSFQVKMMYHEWIEQNVMATLKRETPQSVLNECHITIPCLVPSKQQERPTRLRFREAVLQSLRRTSLDDVSCLQLQFGTGSPYVVDALSWMEELKEEGYIRSLCTRDFPASVLCSASRLGFSVDSNQLDINLLDPSPYSENRMLSGPSQIPILAASPLAGGLLTDAFRDYKKMPLPSSISTPARRHLMTSLKSWGMTHEKGDYELWESYQSNLMATLEDIARIHRVGISSVAVRWTTQLDDVVSSVISSKLVDKDDGLRRKPVAQVLRDVFRFELNNDDMARLWEASGKLPDNEVTREHDDESVSEGSTTEVMKVINGLVLL